jgi:TonB family protein
MRVLDVIVVSALVGFGVQNAYSQDKKMHDHMKKDMNMRMDSCEVKEDTCNMYQQMHENKMHKDNYIMNDKDVTPPKVKKQFSPGYPTDAKQQGAQGLAYICAHIDEKGLVSKVHVMKSSGRYDLDSSAVESVKKYEFEPAMKDGKPVKTEVTIPVQYKLR